jgi:hypothetical protein
MTLKSIWRHWFRRSAEERDAADELEAHVELLVEERVRGGQDEESARRAARIEVGGVEQVRESIRDVRPGRRLRAAPAGRAVRRARPRPQPDVHRRRGAHAGARHRREQRDLQRARRGPHPAAPYTDPSRLVVLWTDFRSSGQPRVPASGHEMVEIRRRTRLLSGVAGVWVGGGAITGAGEPEQVRVASVTGDFLDVLGARPGAGRLLRAPTRVVPRIPWS